MQIAMGVVEGANLQQALAGASGQSKPVFQVFSLTKRSSQSTGLTTAQQQIQVEVFSDQVGTPRAAKFFNAVGSTKANVPIMVIRSASLASAVWVLSVFLPDSPLKDEFRLAAIPALAQATSTGIIQLNLDKYFSFTQSAPLTRLVRAWTGKKQGYQPDIGEAPGMMQFAEANFWYWATEVVAYGAFYQVPKNVAIFMASEASKFASSNGFLSWASDAYTVSATTVFPQLTASIGFFEIAMSGLMGTMVQGMLELQFERYIRYKMARLPVANGMIPFLRDNGEIVFFDEVMLDQFGKKVSEKSDKTFDTIQGLYYRKATSETKADIVWRTLDAKQISSDGIQNFVAQSQFGNSVQERPIRVIETTDGKLLFEIGQKQTRADGKVYRNYISGTLRTLCVFASKASMFALFAMSFHSPHIAVPIQLALGLTGLILRFQGTKQRDISFAWEKDEFRTNNADEISAAEQSIRLFKSARSSLTARGRTGPIQVGGALQCAGNF